MKAKDKLVEIICIDCCDGEGGRCQRYPQLSRSCDKFPELEKAYKAGIKKGLSKKGNPLEPPCAFCGYNGREYWQKQTHSKDCPFYSVGGEEDRRAQLKKWGIG